MEFNLQRLESLGAQYLLEANNLHTCSLCGWTFKSKKDAKLHIEAKHFPTDKGYVCDLCGKSSNSYSSYRMHRSRHNKKQLVLQHCHNIDI